MSSPCVSMSSPRRRGSKQWIPAFAGMTEESGNDRWIPAGDLWIPVAAFAGTGSAGMMLLYYLGFRIYKMLNYSLFIILGLLPSFIWLLFYLQKDRHPEPKEMIIRIFIYGMAVTIPAALMEWGFLEFLKTLAIPPTWLIIIYFLLGVALVEEVIKYLVVKFSALKSHHFDEPVDAMIYMIIAGLGFAAVENILILFPLNEPGLLQKTTLTLFGRFIGATFLHALCSANIGFFLALSLSKMRCGKLLLFFGLFSSTVLHGIYNIAITMKGNTGTKILFFLLLGLFLIVLAEFSKIKKLKSIIHFKRPLPRLSSPL